MKNIGIGLLLLGLFAAPAIAAKAKVVAAATEYGSALKADDIKVEPFRDAKIVGSLASGDKVEILSKDGGWLNVKSTKGNGWVRMLSIRKAGSGKMMDNAGGLLALASGRAGTGKVVATTGIRGLSEEELKTAQFNAEQLTLAESYSVNSAQAQQFAAQGKLKARLVDYLQEGAK
jgi:Bacterial SH3 domain